MLKNFRQKLKKVSPGKRKFLLDKLRTPFSRDEEDTSQRFIYAASLLIDEKKTLKETVLLLKDCFSVTSAQYEYYFSVWDAYKNSLTDIGREKFCLSVMEKDSSQKTLAISAKIRQNTKH